MFSRASDSRNLGRVQAASQSHCLREALLEVLGEGHPGGDTAGHVRRVLKLDHQGHRGRGSVSCQGKAEEA